jgi:hypothetical protein
MDGSHATLRDDMAPAIGCLESCARRGASVAAFPRGAWERAMEPVAGIQPSETGGPVSTKIHHRQAHKKTTGRHVGAPWVVAGAGSGGLVGVVARLG